MDWPGLPARLAGRSEPRCEEKADTGYRCALIPRHRGNHLDRAQANRLALADAPLEMTIAGAMDRRFGAYLGDAAAVGLVSVLVQGLPIVREQSLPGRLAMSTAVSAGLSLAYFLWFWTRGRGATPFMHLAGLHLLASQSHGPIGLRSAIARWFVLVGAVQTMILVGVTAPWSGAASLRFAAVGYLLFLYQSSWRDPWRRGYHDRTAGSVVVESGTAALPILALYMLAVALVILELVIVYQWSR